jgi:pimeloyl-ACP methyl ester carboxylesterase
MLMKTNRQDAAENLALNNAGNDSPRTDSGRNETGVRQGTVILLHGLGAGSWLMSLLAMRLRHSGYDVRIWGYRSIRQSLESLIDHFTERFRELSQDESIQGPIHIVAHSLGSIITREALAQVDLSNVHRIVLLSPPLKGSFFASWVGPYLMWLSPLIDQLADREDSFVNRLAGRFPPHVEVGVIAAEWDYVLTERATHLENQTDHIVLPSRHTGLVLRRRAADQIRHFLQHGTFHRAAEQGTVHRDDAVLPEMSQSN